MPYLIPDLNAKPIERVASTLMSFELRRRTASRGTETGRTSPPPSSPATPPMADNLNYDESNLSARALLSASPVHSSHAWKLHVPAIYAMMPRSIRRLLSCGCCPARWGPRWKRRRLVALGGFLYRFEDFEDDDGGGGGGGGVGGGGGGGPPKGAPVPVATADVRAASDRDYDGYDYDDVVHGPGGLLETLPAGCRAAFEVSSSGKTRYFAVQTAEEAATWVTSLRQMRQDAITRKMGHSGGVPYPRNWESFDASARRLGEKRSRIKSRLEAMEKREVEMQTMGGGVSMGYFS